MLKLKLQYFGHLMSRADSLEKTLMLGKTEGNRRRGWQRMRWLESITDSMDMHLSNLWETVKDRGAWWAAVHGAAKSWTWLSDWTATATCLPNVSLSIQFTPIKYVKAVMLLHIKATAISLVTSKGRYWLHTARRHNPKIHPEDLLSRTTCKTCCLSSVSLENRIWKQRWNLIEKAARVEREMRWARKRSSAGRSVLLQLSASPPSAKSPGRCFRKYVCSAMWDVSRQC